MHLFNNSNKCTNNTILIIEYRELAFQISEQFEALGSAIGVTCAVVVGGIGTSEFIMLYSYIFIYVYIHLLLNCR